MAEMENMRSENLQLSDDIKNSRVVKQLEAHVIATQQLHGLLEVERTTNKNLTKDISRVRKANKVLIIKKRKAVHPCYLTSDKIVLRFLKKLDRATRGLWFQFRVSPLRQLGYLKQLFRGNSKGYRNFILDVIFTVRRNT